MRIVKKIAKITGIVVLSITMLLLLICFLIYLPPVQKKLTTKAVSFLENKTHGHFKIDGIYLVWPLKIKIEGFEVKDPAGKLVASIGSLKTSASLTSLFKRKLVIGIIDLRNTEANIIRSQTDSSFNFSFITDAFADTTAKEEPAVKDTSKSGFAIEFSDLHFEKIKLVFNDRLSGMNAAVNLGELNASVRENDLDSMIFSLKNLALENTNVSLTINPSAPKPVDTTASVLPSLKVKDIDLKNIAFTYINHVDSSEMRAKLGVFAVDDLEADLKNNNISIDKITLNHSSYTQLDEHLAAEADSAGQVIDSSAKTGMTIKVGNVSMVGNSVVMHQKRMKDTSPSFNAARLDIADLSGDISDIIYSAEQTSADIAGLHFRDADRFTLNNLAVKVAMRGGKIVVNNLDVSTPGTTLKADVKLNAASMEALSKTPGKTALDVNLKADRIAGSDMIYWTPALSKVTAVDVRKQIVGLTFIADGSVEDMNVKTFVFTAASHTSLAFNGKLKGLPDAKKLSYAVPNLKFYTTRSDLYSIVNRKQLPAAINIPNAVLLNASLNGDPSGIKTQMNLGTEFGGLSTIAALHFGPDTSYEALVTTNNFNLHRLMVNDSSFGLASVQLKLSGKDFDPDQAKVDYNLVINHFDFNHYGYSSGIITGFYDRRNISSNIRFDDPSLDLLADIEAGLKKDSSFYKVNLDLKGANLKALHLYDDELRIAARVSADLKGNDMNHVNGSAGVTRLMLIKDSRTYVLDSLLFASVNQPGKNNMKFSSSVISVDLDGNVAPGDLGNAINAFINRYYAVSDTTVSIAQAFTFRVEIRNHPVLPDIFLPGLTDFLPSVIEGSFDNRKDQLTLNVTVPRIRYNGSAVDNFELKVSSDAKALNCNVSVDNLASGNYGLTNFQSTATLHDNQADVRVRAGSKDKEKRENEKLDLAFVVGKASRNTHRIHLNSPVKLARKDWVVPEDNAVIVGGENTEFNHFKLTSGNEEIAVQTQASALTAEFKAFNLADLSSLVTDDTLPIAGLLNGFLKLANAGGKKTMDADVRIDSMMVMQVPVGVLAAKASSESSSGYRINVNLTGPSTDMTVSGTVDAGTDATKFNLNTNIKSLNASMLDGLSFGALSHTSGNISGDVALTGTSKEPAMNGAVKLTSFTTTPAATNSPVVFKNETITLSTGKVVLNDFTIVDAKQNTADINGQITLEGFAPGIVDIKLNANHFNVFNTTRKPEDLYYGVLNLDGVVTVKGSVDLPVINANIQVDEGSAFAFVVPQSKLTTDRGEMVLVFDDSTKLSPVLTDDTQKAASGGFKGMSLTSRLTVNKEASLKVLIDPSAGDSLVVQGEATLALTMNPAGDISLTGLYELTDGSYITSLQDLVQKKFEIVDGSTIRWNGDPLDADLDITAEYTVKTSPADLVAGQIGGLSEQEQNQYKQRLTFNVLLKLKGKLLKPDIAFQIDLDDTDKGALGGSVESKLRQLNNDQSELNKQVFALLLLNRFIQEDPLASAGGGGGGEAVARTSVSKFLSSQLNKMAGRYVAGAELSFNVDSYDDYKSGSAEGRTEVGVALKKQFFDDRFSVQVGSNIDVEGEAAKTNTLSDITGDVLIEYKLTPDGRFRASGFRKNEYLDVLEGQVTETGVGLLYMKDFDRWKYLFKKSRSKQTNEAAKD